MSSEGATRVSIWFTRMEEVPDALFARYRELLNAEEVERCDRFVFDRHRREYLVTRALARAALSRHRARPLEAWQFVRDERGKPSAPSSGLEFNLSNHPTMIVCAVTEGACVGVDVEPLSRGDEILTVAETVFSTSERASLARLPPEARAARAVSLWTAKEAYIKARGDGLSLPLLEMTVAFDREDTATHIELSPAIDDGDRYAFARVDLHGHRIHVAVRTSADLELRVAPLLPRSDPL